MKAFLTQFVATLLAALTCALYSFAHQQPEYEMGKMQMVFLSRSPEWKSAGRGFYPHQLHQLTRFKLLLVPELVPVAFFSVQHPNG